MNILGIGVDIIEIDRIESAIKKNNKFLSKLFTKQEIIYFESKDFNYNTIAGNFAAKEAISKAMGTGIRNFNFIDIEVLRDELGKPIVITYNNLNKICEDIGIIEIKISISHCKTHAIANAIAITKE